MIAFITVQSTLFNSNSLGGRENVRITKISNYADSSHEAFCSEIFKGPENFVRIGKSLNYMSLN